MQTTKSSPRRLIRLPEVCRLAGIGPTKVWEDERQDLFPKRVKLASRSVAWVEDEIAVFNQARIAGASNDELRALVKTLTAARSQALDNLSVNLQSANGATSTSK